MHLPILAVAVLVATLPPGGTFIDDDGDTHEGGIEAIASAGITLGCNPPANDRFCPHDTVTRGQMAAFLTRALGLPDTTADFFTDDQGHPFEAAIDRIATAGIALGCDPPANDRYCPDQDMTRGQMAMMLARAFELPSPTNDYFLDDDGLVSESAINRIAEAGVTRGCNPPAGDNFCPNAPVTRAQMATFLTRALGLEPLVPSPRPRSAIAVVTREAWGAAAPEVSEMVPHVVDKLTVHHTGNVGGLTGAARIREMQEWHMMGQGWPDLAYHVVIGRDGTVYEGRDPAYRGDTGTSYDTTGHYLVVLEGNFEVERPTSAQWDSLVTVLAWAADHYEVSPDTISGHSDHAATLCPGRYLEHHIHSGELASAAKRAIDAGGVDLRWP
jgi:hypothetical protein